MALEVGLRPIQVNAIIPGMTITPMAKATLPSNNITHRLASNSLLLRNGVPNDVAGALLAWLLSEDATYVTGQEIRVMEGLRWDMQA
ncbi:SDR family oxidoreductase [Sodalis-like endosymbiont of Proechinophthirus fluctus]|uniref:SDR family oxidoreductase n=1 Tax=Sodalis-like endosymbiont of Proechinophthirus fluctus TaxID=1462730 RepID=UPI00082C4EB7